ncbi:MAG: hypothetical protein AAF915_07595 [Cyanobacteria bacterium P01_D01_bin.50]
MTSQESKFCFCTLALGANYCNLALELAKDLKEHAPTISLIILTDQPQKFSQLTNVLAFGHRQQSIGCYHDKRFAIAKALSLFNSCIFIDADMRIIASIPDDLAWQPGITARIAWHNILKHNKNKSEINILNKIAHKLNLNLADITFVHECLFVVTKDKGRELEFLNNWERIAAYCELHKFYRGEGHTIGLAAAQAGMEIRTNSMPQIQFFKDKLELNKIKSGKVEKSEVDIYFDKQKELEYPNKSILFRFTNKIGGIIMYLYRSLRLRFFTMIDIKFYYL